VADADTDEMEVGSEDPSPTSRWKRPRLTDEANELHINLRVGYKTVLLVTVIFDLIHTSIQEVVNKQVIDQLVSHVVSLTPFV